MAATTTDIYPRMKPGPGGYRDEKVLMKASEAVPKGVLVSINTDGVAVNSTDAAGEYVRGVAVEAKTAAASGNYWLIVRSNCYIEVLLASAAQADVGDNALFALYNNEVARTAGVTNDVPAGFPVWFATEEDTAGVSGKIWIYIPPTGCRRMPAVA